MTFEKAIEKLHQPRLVWQEIVIPQELLAPRSPSGADPKDWVAPFSQNFFRFLKNWAKKPEKNGNSFIDPATVNDALTHVFVEGNRQDISQPILINVFSAKNGLMLKIRASSKELSVHEVFIFDRPG